MSPGVLGTRWGTHLLFMVAEFTLFVLFFDFAAVHSGSFSFSARTLFFFSSFSCRLSLLLRCLLLLLQDSAFPLILYKDRRQTNSPPLSNCPELPDTLATSMKCPRLNGRKVAGKSGTCAVVSGWSDIPRHSPVKAAPEGSCRWMDLSDRADCAAGKLLSSLLRVGEGWREGFPGWGNRWDAPVRWASFIKCCWERSRFLQISANHQLDQLGVILVLQHSSLAPPPPRWSPSVCSRLKPLIFPSPPGGAILSAGVFRSNPAEGICTFSQNRIFIHSIVPGSVTDKTIFPPSRTI